MTYGLMCEEVLAMIREFKSKSAEVERMTRDSLLTPPAQDEYLRIFADRLRAFRRV